ncbi:hypothetical protein Asulf_01324 [Archaeoglobus sulfaticallidus PM70-1]|uniref:Uncharacterized protein n=1 Tax=Archaeoglobus sulfaticallidus PM70-1 TaxID=387631 RepID=N0BM25_9EURY|nr:hypothetical protein Asulf_01324 [Archaeoglobus sulfaticallidus PM70-1]
MGSKPLEIIAAVRCSKLNKLVPISECTECDYFSDSEVDDRRGILTKVSCLFSH